MQLKILTNEVMGFVCTRTLCLRVLYDANVAGDSPQRTHCQGLIVIYPTLVTAQRVGEDYCRIP